MGIALWHFTVFLPDRFWQGIVGAFLGAVIGAIVFGAIVEIARAAASATPIWLTALTGDARRRDRPRRRLGRRLRSERSEPT